jgi:hypothetical protein
VRRPKSTDAISAECAFFERFYKWALDDWNREIADGLPILGPARSSTSFAYVQITTGLSPASRLALGRALVKRSHGIGRSATGEEMTDEESELLRWYSKAKLLKLAVDRIGGMVGQSVRKTAAEQWFQLEIGNWKILTMLDTVQQMTSLRYNHRVSRSDMTQEERMRIGALGHAQNVTSIQQWLGFYPVTEWRASRDEDVEIALAGLALAIGIFIPTFTRLVEGLD